ncbi:hypothetical protein [Gimesia panareensis]|uniref:hypothetical protein n=1 Tax=Gimesia panareensis TaxID=2527978 RepID=UPI00118C2D06|nr:hypothetical protein [Gimesia panareensis]QDU49237.1 hypothetical protein Pan110_15560 [Gimesia panareensis]
MKPVTVITGAIAISLGSVLLTGSGYSRNNPQRLNEDTVSSSEMIGIPQEKNSPFMKSADILDTSVTCQHDGDASETDVLVLNMQNSIFR